MTAGTPEGRESEAVATFAASERTRAHSPEARDAGAQVNTPTPLREFRLCHCHDWRLEECPNVGVAALSRKGEAMGEHIMQFFTTEHLPENLAKHSRVFAALAKAIIESVPRNPERAVALRKLLEAKDATVRAVLAGDEPADGPESGS